MSAAIEETADTQQRLLDIIQAMLAELRGPSGAIVSIDADLERDLGIDSLARAELMLRIESAFGVRLPEEAALAASTPGALLRLIRDAYGTGAVAPAVALPVRVAPVTAEAEALDEPRHCAHLIDVLEWHATRHPDRVHITLLEGDDTPLELRYGELAREARRVAGGLQARGLQPGRAVAIMLPTGFAFFGVFYGVLYAGGVPVPIYPPFRRTQLEEHLRRQLRIMRNCAAAMLVADARTLALARLLRSPTGEPQVVTAQILAAHDEIAATADARRGQEVALLQYTSGSTGHPKGVILNHAHLLANIRAMGVAVNVTGRDRFVSWLPLYHDMGLIGAWLGTLYYGIPLVLLSPQSFLARPSRWLWAIHRYRGTLSAAPNFAYEIVASKVRDEDLAGLDLGTWRVAFNGAEPVQAATLERFAERYASCGFDARAMTPVYGLAECAVGLTFTPVGRGARIDCIDRDRLATERRAVPAAAGEPVVRVVSCGRPLPGYEVRVLDDMGREVTDRAEGRVEFRGPSATSGYFDNATATAALLHEGWLDTGDVGYIADGELYLTSRQKDLIIRGGHNIHPYDLEEAIAGLEGVRRGSVAVFGATDRATGSERIVVLAEIRTLDPAHRQALHSRIADLAIAHLGVPADDIVLTPARVVLKTSSGKIRRAACRDFYERGVLTGAPRPVWLQVSRLAASGLYAQLRAGAQRAMRMLYAAYLWLLFAMVAIAGAVLCAILPSITLRRRCAKRMARTLIALSGIPFSVVSAPPPSGRCIYVANHASYIDAIVLGAALPADITFTAKREFLQEPVARWFFTRLGVRYVARFEAEQGIEDTDALVAAAQRGEALVFFPEGGFSRAPGLAPFRMGAFVVAARTQTAVVPVTLRGTRSVLRTDTWFPRRYPIEVRVLAAQPPQGADWAAAIALRDAARRAILAECGEPDLAR